MWLFVSLCLSVFAVFHAQDKIMWVVRIGVEAKWKIFIFFESQGICVFFRFWIAQSGVSHISKWEDETDVI